MVASAFGKSRGFAIGCHAQPCLNLERPDDGALGTNARASGSRYDNAAVESFFASLKRERVHQRKYRTRDEATTDVVDYIERFYNRERRHSYLGQLSPVEYEDRHSGPR